MAANGIGTSNTIDQIIKKTENASNQRKTGSDSLGKNDFLNLLITQLRYQDPLNPTDDKEFIAQMAQFSSLEQMQNMNSVLTNSEAFGMVGKYVTGSVTDETTKETSEVEGKVSSVKMKDGKVYLEVDGRDVSVDKISKVVDMGSANSDISSYTNLIGCLTKGAVYDSSTGDIIYLSGDVTQIQKGTNEDYAVMNNVNVNIAGVTGTASSDPNYTKNYLEKNIGKEVSVTIKDKKSGDKVPVTATLKSYNIAEDGTVTGVLDGVNIPVESVANIQKPTTSATSK